jgi:hypothetical protein
VLLQVTFICVLRSQISRSIINSVSTELWLQNVQTAPAAAGGARADELRRGVVLDLLAACDRCTAANFRVLSHASMSLLSASSSTSSPSSSSSLSSMHKRMRTQSLALAANDVVVYVELVSTSTASVGYIDALLTEQAADSDSLLRQGAWTRFLSQREPLRYACGAATAGDGFVS